MFQSSRFPLLSKLFFALFSFVLVVFILFFIFRSSFLSNISQRYIHRFEKEHHCQLNIKSISIEGLQTVALSDLCLRGDSSAPLLKLAKLKVSIKLLPLLAGKVAIKTLDVQNVELNLTNKAGVNNYSFLIRSSNKDKQSGEKNFSNSADQILDRIFGKIPSEVLVNDAHILFTKDSLSSLIDIKNLTYKNRRFKTSVKSHQSNSLSDFAIEGTIHAGDRTLDLQFKSNIPNSQIPLLNDFFGLTVMFDSLNFTLDKNEQSDEILSLTGKTELKGLVVNHWRIASSDVVLNSGELKYKINIGKDYIEIDSSSVVAYNKLAFSPYLKYRSSASKQFTLKIDKPLMEANDFLGSFPIGLFKNIENIKAKGKLGFHFLFDVDLSKPDSLVYECLLSSKQFAIEQLGNSGLAKMNSEFTYTAYENDQVVKSFPIGASSPDFVTVDAVSDYLKNSILIAEDPEFFRHRGFSTEAFRESIIKNIKEKRFARGGSTLSMQLVKNVFLNRSKNISRKIEEALIVWLIENNHITTKDRMFEVYLNIIEWGPRIYGAKAASEFYFSKQASKLSLAESIFLAYLIPHPKYFASSFDATGHLKPYMMEYYRLLSSKLARKNMISAADTAQLVPDVQLKGIAKNYLKNQILPMDSIPVFESDF